jgi:histidine triad (HIT) family protein
MSADCIFCKIIAGELPATKVYEDDDALAFMDIGPVSKGHTLVIPKLHCDPITDVPAETLQKLILVVQKIATAQFKGLDADGITVTQANGEAAGQVVPHIHFHVIPRSEDDPQLRNWIPGNYDSTEEIEQFADKIRSALDK